MDSYCRGNIGIKLMKVKICFQMVPGRKSTIFVIDMERAVENSLGTVFGDTNVIYCEEEILHYRCPQSSSLGFIPRVRPLSALKKIGHS